MRRFVLLSMVVLGVFAQLSFAHSKGTGSVGIKRFHVVNPDLDRGGRPTDAGLQWLAEDGINTIVDLEDNDEAVAHEKEVAEGLGIKFISFPVDSFSKPSDELVNSILDALTNSGNHRMFLHCHHGEDRTGMIMALYRVRYDSWTPEKAYKEMIADGFSLGAESDLAQYFDEQTGYKPAQ